MAKHVYVDHENKCPDPGRCMFCDGGLLACTVCGGAEGDLTKDCPGRLLTPQEKTDIYAGRLDCVDGEMKWLSFDADGTPTRR